MDQKLKEKLIEELDECSWIMLEKHLEREQVVIVGSGLNLIEVAIAIAKDDTAFIKPLLGSKKIEKASNHHRSKWQNTDTKFSMLIIDPFVLIQEKNITLH